MSLEDYPNGVCFRTAFIGHASAFSQAYYSPLRGASISLFRQIFVGNFMHGMWRLPSLPEVDGEILHEHEQEVATGKDPVHSEAASAQFVIYLYNKTMDRMAPGFRCAHICIGLAAVHLYDCLTLAPSQLCVA